MQLAARDVELLRYRVDDLEDSLAAALAKIEAHRLRENALRQEAAALRLALVAAEAAGGRGKEGVETGEAKLPPRSAGARPGAAVEEDAAKAAAAAEAGAAAAAAAPSSSPLLPPPPPHPPATTAAAAGAADASAAADIALLPGHAPGSLVVGPDWIDFYARVPRVAFLGIVPAPREQQPTPPLPPPSPPQPGHAGGEDAPRGAAAPLAAARLGPAPSADAPFPAAEEGAPAPMGAGAGDGGDGARRRQGDDGCGGGAPPPAPAAPAARKEVSWAARLAGLVGAGGGGSNGSLSSMSGGGAGRPPAYPPASVPARADADADASRAAALAAAAAVPGADEGATAVWHPMPLPSFSRQDSLVAIRRLQQQQRQEQRQQEQRSLSSGGGGGGGSGAGAMVAPVPLQAPAGAGSAAAAATAAPDAAAAAAAVTTIAATTATPVPAAAAAAAAEPPAPLAPSGPAGAGLGTAPSLRLAAAWQVLWRASDPSAPPHRLTFEAPPEARELLRTRTAGWGPDAEDGGRDAQRAAAPFPPSWSQVQGAGANGGMEQGRSGRDSGGGGQDGGGGYRDADGQDADDGADGDDDGGFELAMPRHLAPPLAPAASGEPAPSSSAGAAPPPPPPPRLSEPSSVVGPDVVAHPDLWLRGLASALPARFARRESWLLAYSTRRDGTALSTLLRRARGLAPTVLLVRDGGGGVFGAFCPEAWRRAARFYGSGEAFVFQLAPHLVAYPWRARGARGGRRNDYFQLCAAEGLAMGGGGGAFGIWLDEELRRGASGRCATFGSPCLATSAEFDVMGVELWHVGGGHAAAGGGGGGGGHHQYGGGL